MQQQDVAFRVKKKRVLIADNNEESASVSRDFFGMFEYDVIGVACDGKQAIEMVIKEKPDVVFVEVFLPEYDALAILQELQARDYQSKGIFIATSFVNNQKMIKSIMDNGADLFLLKPFDYNYVNRRIEELLYRKAFKPAHSYFNNIPKVCDSFDLENCISKLMHDMGVPPHIRGYRYIRKAITLALENEDILNSITKELYPTVANAYNTTPSRVERAIRHAIEVAWSRGDVEAINMLFGYTIKYSKGKPTNGEFISMMTERLRLDLKMG